MRKILLLFLFLNILYGQDKDATTRTLEKSTSSNINTYTPVENNLEALLWNYENIEDLDSNRILRYHKSEKLKTVKGGPASPANIKSIHNSVVYIIAQNISKNSRSAGTGVIINEQGDILTANHIIKDKTKILILHYSEGDETRYVSEHRKRLLRATPIKYSENRDLALLSIEENKDISYSPVSLGLSATIQQGNEVHSIGHPNDWLYTYSKGVVQNFANKYNHPTLPMFKANSILVGFDGLSGQSGSPVFNKKNQMIGLIISKDLQEKFILAIKIDEIRDFIK